MSHYHSLTHFLFGTFSTYSKTPQYITINCSINHTYIAMPLLVSADGAFIQWHRKWSGTFKSTWEQSDAWIHIIDRLLVDFECNPWFSSGFGARVVQFSLTHFDIVQWSVPYPETESWNPNGISYFGWFDYNQILWRWGKHDFSVEWIGSHHFFLPFGLYQWFQHQHQHQRQHQMRWNKQSG